jgi:hypothetical protein
LAPFRTLVTPDARAGTSFLVPFDAPKGFPCGAAISLI